MNTKYHCQIKLVKVGDVSSLLCGNWNQCIAVLMQIFESLLNSKTFRAKTQ